MQYTEIMVRYGELSTKGKTDVTLSIAWVSMSDKQCMIFQN